MKKVLMMAAVCVMATATFAVGEFGFDVYRLSELPEAIDIDLTDITSVPVGSELLLPKVRIPDGSSDIVHLNVPPELSAGGKCGALRITGIILERRTKQIRGAMGSHVYPTVAEGAFAITNGLQKAVLSASHRIGMFYPLQIEKDGSGTIRYEWNANGKTLELLVKCYVNERRQMAVCTLLHVKGDGLRAGLGDGLQNQPNKKGTTK